MKGLTLNQREQTRLEILNRVLQGWVHVHEAAPLLGLSERQAWRLSAAYRKEGAAALAHGDRGRRPVNTTPSVVRDQVVTLARTQYAGLNHTHLTELLAERASIGLARTTVRKILTEAGVPSPRRRRPPPPLQCIVIPRAACPNLSPPGIGIPRCPLWWLMGSVWI